MFIVFGFPSKSHYICVVHRYFLLLWIHSRVVQEKNVNIPWIELESDNCRLNVLLFEINYQFLLQQKLVFYDNFNKNSCNLFVLLDRFVDYYSIVTFIFATGTLIQNHSQFEQMYKICKRFGFNFECRGKMFWSKFTPHQIFCKVISQFL